MICRGLGVVLTVAVMGAGAVHVVADTPGNTSAAQPASTGAATAPGVTLVNPKPLKASTLTATGRVHALTAAKISPRVSGHLVEVGKTADGKPLEAGMTVKKGDVLFTLSQTSFRNAVASAEAAVASARAALENLRAPTRPERIEQLRQAISEVTARLDEARKDVQRFTRLVEEKTAPAKRLEEARTNQAATEAQLRAAQARLDEAVAGPTKTEIAVAEARVKETETALKIATDELADTVVAAPWDGTILRRLKSPGDYIAANPPVEVFELLATDVLEVELRVPEAYFARIGAGQTKVTLSSPLLKTALEAAVTRVVADIDPARGTFPCRVAIPQGSRLVPGAFITAEIHLEATDAALLVPSRAVFTEGAKAYVIVSENGKFVRRDVSIADRLTESVVVRAGLALTDQIALDPPESARQAAAAHK